MREPVTLYRMDEKVTRIRDGWEFRPHGRLAWLQRLLWRALARMRAVGPHMTDKIEMIRLPCDGDTILEKIMQARVGLFAVYREPREVLIGPETLSELIGSPELRDWNSPFTIDATAAWGTANGRRLFNLPVHVVPTMEGVIVR